MWSVCRSSVVTLPSFLSSLNLITSFPSKSPNLIRMASSSSPSSHHITDNNSNPDNASVSPSSAIDFLTLCQSLKKTKRAGWVKRNVENPESISDHMYRMGLMALISADIPGVNRDKCVKIAIVHDIAEAIVGDITPSDGISKIEKAAEKRKHLTKCATSLVEDQEVSSVPYSLASSFCYSISKEIYDLWMEYEESSSMEAKIVKDFDKVEMILQALEYEKEQGKDLEEFFESTAGKFQTDIGKAWALEIASRRKKP
ncbi:HD domain-containing protein 2 [Bienertia sinuspersici]